MVHLIPTVILSSSPPPPGGAVNTTMPASQGQIKTKSLLKNNCCSHCLTYRHLECSYRKV